MAVIEDIGKAAAALGTLIADAGRAVVFTGAGISTESGIPDFRSPGGLWERVKPIMFDDFLASEAVRREDWRRRFAMIDRIGEARPNAGHRAIARLVAEGRIDRVITQNIDGLHQRSGVPEEKIIELHGNGTYATCLDCGARYEFAPLRTAFEATGIPPGCEYCGGLVKAAVISFGQPMPPAEMRRAEAATLAADLFIALGSSLVVYPAAGFPVLAKRNGARLVIINRDPTQMDEIADLVIHAQIGPLMARVTPEQGHGK